MAARGLSYVDGASDWMVQVARIHGEEHEKAQFALAGEDNDQDQRHFKPRSQHARRDNTLADHELATVTGGMFLRSAERHMFYRQV